jgi:hypothetical protein
MNIIQWSEYKKFFNRDHTPLVDFIAEFRKGKKGSLKHELRT